MGKFVPAQGAKGAKGAKGVKGAKGAGKAPIAHASGRGEGSADASRVEGMPDLDQIIARNLQATLGGSQPPF